MSAWWSLLKPSFSLKGSCWVFIFVDINKILLFKCFAFMSQVTYGHTPYPTAGMSDQTNHHQADPTIIRMEWLAPPVWMSDPVQKLLLHLHLQLWKTMTRQSTTLWLICAPAQKSALIKVSTQGPHFYYQFSRPAQTLSIKALGCRWMEMRGWMVADRITNAHNLSSWQLGAICFMPSHP